MPEKPKDSKSMREVAYLHIQRKIATRTLRAGTPVSELSIANELGISRTPAREAMRQLVAEGLLDDVPGRGVVVVTLGRDDINDLYEMREALEVQGARKAARLAVSPIELSNLRRVGEEMAGLIKELEKTRGGVLNEKQMSRFEAADLGFHSYLMIVAGNRRSLKTVNSIRLLIRIFAMRRAGHDLVALKRIHGEHLEVIAGLEARQPERAAKALSKHIMESWRDRLVQFELREREASLPRNIEAFLSEIHADLV